MKDSIFFLISKFLFLSFLKEIGDPKPSFFSINIFFFQNFVINFSFFALKI